MDNVALRLVQLQRERFDATPWYGFIAGGSDQLVVHREAIHPDECEIGQVRMAEDRDRGA